MRRIPRADEIEIRRLIGGSRRMQRLSTSQKANLVQILSTRYEAPCWAIRSLLNLIDLERTQDLAAVDGDAPPEPSVSWAELRAAMDGDKVWRKK